jgi:hypothetical protein
MLTMNDAVPVFPDVSVAVQFTLVTPKGKKLPDFGVHVGVTASQLSVAAAL